MLFDFFEIGPGESSRILAILEYSNVPLDDFEFFLLLLNSLFENFIFFLDFGKLTLRCLIHVSKVFNIEGEEHCFVL